MADPKAALLIILGQPIRPGDAQRFADEAANGLAQWQTDAVDLPTELLNFLNSTDHTQQIPEIGLRSETGSLFLHILTSCKSKIIAEALRNLVANVRSPYKHIVFAGNVFSDGGDWSTADSRVSSATVARHLQLDVNAVTATEGDSAVKTKVVVASPTDSWTNAAFSRVSNDWQTVSVNPQGKSTTADFVPADFISFVKQTMRQPAELAQLLPAAEDVGAVGFQRPTFYVFPGGQEDCGLLGVGGFTLLLDGGYERKPGYWDFIRHFDRINALLISRASADSLRGVATMFERKASADCHPKIGAVIANLPSTTATTPAGDDAALDHSLSAELATLTAGLSAVGLNATPAFATAPKLEPIVLYKVFGQGRLEMLVLNPAKEAKDLQSLSTALKNANGGEGVEKLAAAAALAVLLVWHPDDPKQPTVRVLYPAACPLDRLYSALEKLNKTPTSDYLKHPEFITANISHQHPVQALFAANKKLAPPSTLAAPRPASSAAAKLSVPFVSTRRSLTAQKKPDLPANQKKAPTPTAAASAEPTAQLKKATAVGGAANSTARRAPPSTTSTAGGAAKKPSEPTKKAPVPSRPAPAAAAGGASKKPAPPSAKDAADKSSTDKSSTDKNAAKPKPIRKPTTKEPSPSSLPTTPVDSHAPKEHDMPPTPTQPTPAEDDRHHAAPSPPAEDNQPDQPAAPTPTHAGDATDGYGRPNGGHDDADGDAHTKQPSPAPVCDDIEEPCVRMNISMDTDELEKELGLPALDAAHDDSHHLQAEVVDDSLGGRSPDFETGKAWEGEQVLDQQPSAGAFEDARMDDHKVNVASSSPTIEEKETARGASEMDLLLEGRDGAKSPAIEGLVRSIAGGDDDFAQHLRLQDPYPGMHTPAHEGGSGGNKEEDTSFFTGDHDDSIGGSVRPSNEHTDLTNDFSEKVVLNDSTGAGLKPAAGEQSPIERKRLSDLLESSHDETGITMIDQRHLDASTLSGDELKDNNLLEVGPLMNATQAPMDKVVDDGQEHHQQQKEEHHQQQQEHQHHHQQMDEQEHHQQQHQDHQQQQHEHGQHREQQDGHEQHQQQQQHQHQHHEHQHEHHEQQLDHQQQHHEHHEHQEQQHDQHQQEHQQHEISPTSVGDHSKSLHFDEDTKSPQPPSTPSVPDTAADAASPNDGVHATTTGEETSIKPTTPATAETQLNDNDKNKPDGDISPQKPSQQQQHDHQQHQQQQQQQQLPTATVDDLKGEWGEPLGLPTPPPAASASNGSAAKKGPTPTASNAPSASAARRVPPRSSAAQKPAGPPPARSAGLGRAPSASSAKAPAKAKPAALSSPIYVDVAYIPHHGDKVSAGEEFFDLVRAKYYVLSVTEVGTSTLDAWLAAKKAWKRPDLSSNLVPTYDCDALSLWIREHEDQLADENMDVRASAERCELTMQRAGSEPCAAYKIEL